MKVNLSLKAKFIITITTGLLILTLTLSFLHIKDIRKQGIEEIISVSRALTLTVESVREEMQNKWDKQIFTIDQLREWQQENRQDKILEAIPVVSAWKAAMSKANEGGYEFRVPKFSPRNPANIPNDFEARAIKTIKENALSDYYEINRKDNTVHFFRPIKLTETCLYCHGNPRNSETLWGNNEGLDPTGGPMENWKSGDIHGAFEIIMSLDKTDQKTGIAILSTVILSLLIIVVLLVVSFIIVRSITNPINRMVRLSEDISRGDLTVEIPSEYTRQNTEVGTLSRAMQMIVDNLNRLIGEIKFTAIGISQGTNQVSDASQALSQGAQDLAANIEQVNRSIEQINQSVEKNTDYAINSEKIATRSSHDAKIGGEKVQQSVESIHKIAQTVGIISEIANNTNMLALNAAIEAARAGKLGEGFTVVATEVRKLAERSLKAAEEIKKIAGSSVAVSQEAGDLINQIIPDILQTTEMVQNIAHFSREQLESISNLSSSAFKQQSVSEMVSASSEELAASAEEISSQAGNLTDILEQFKTKGEE